MSQKRPSVQNEPFDLYKRRHVELFKYKNDTHNSKRVPATMMEQLPTLRSRNETNKCVQFHLGAQEDKKQLKTLLSRSDAKLPKYDWFTVEPPREKSLIPLELLSGSSIRSPKFASKQSARAKESKKRSLPQRVQNHWLRNDFMETKGSKSMDLPQKKTDNLILGKQLSASKKGRIQNSYRLSKCKKSNTFPTGDKKISHRKSIERKTMPMSHLILSTKDYYDLSRLSPIALKREEKYNWGHIKTPSKLRSHKTSTKFGPLDMSSQAPDSMFDVLEQCARIREKLKFSCLSHKNPQARVENTKQSILPQDASPSVHPSPHIRNSHTFEVVVSSPFATPTPESNDKLFQMQQKVRTTPFLVSNINTMKRSLDFAEAPSVLTQDNTIVSNTKTHGEKAITSLKTTKVTHNADQAKDGRSDHSTNYCATQAKLPPCISSGDYTGKRTSSIAKRLDPKGSRTTRKVSVFDLLFSKRIKEDSASFPISPTHIRPGAPSNSNHNRSIAIEQNSSRVGTPACMKSASQGQENLNTQCPHKNSKEFVPIFSSQNSFILQTRHNLSVAEPSSSRIQTNSPASDLKHSYYHLSRSLSTKSTIERVKNRISWEELGKTCRNLSEGSDEFLRLNTPYHESKSAAMKKKNSQYYQASSCKDQNTFESIDAEEQTPEALTDKIMVPNNRFGTSSVNDEPWLPLGQICKFQGKENSLFWGNENDKLSKSELKTKEKKGFDLKAELRTQKNQKNEHKSYNKYESSKETKVVVECQGFRRLRLRQKLDLVPSYFSTKK
ncbi:hypothetical protein O181_046640 [Austropuccinia psidii MF-1]|uniref:Uncharacterized protein n=1 Tax=Austropuccinia psidii MF-1 TaxID=1389203 RepID=A0A9Q3DNW3_9BASI|nr:hypothetical protein [Austropuccinia psidii MF-1]